MPFNYDDVPKASQLRPPVLRALRAFGGSATRDAIRGYILAQLGHSDEQLEELLAVPYPSGRTRCAFDVHLSSALHDLKESGRITQDDTTHRYSLTEPGGPTGGPPPPDDDPDDDPDDWKNRVLERLWRLNDEPGLGRGEAFEWFVIRLLHEHGLELEHRGRSGDDGIDAIGVVPLNDLFAVRVAIQTKCNNPSGTGAVRKNIIRDFRDAARIAGCERAILVSTESFQSGVPNAAVQGTPNVELIGGDRLCEMMRDKSFCLTRDLQVDESALAEITAEARRQAEGRRGT